MSPPLPVGGRNSDPPLPARAVAWIKANAPAALGVLGVVFVVMAVAMVVIGLVSLGDDRTTTVAPPETVTTVAPPTVQHGVTSQQTTVAIMTATTRLVTSTSSNRRRQTTDVAALAPGDTTVVTSTHRLDDDTVEVAFLSVGLLLIFAGAFYGRINELDFPGGGSIKLGPADEADLETKAIAARRDPKLQRELVRRTKQALADRAGSRHDDEIDAAFSQALQGLAEDPEPKPPPDGDD